MRRSIWVLGVALGLAPFGARAATISATNLVSPSAVAAGGDFSGHDGFDGFSGGVLSGDGFSAAGLFVGQMAALNGNFEVVGGGPTAPLTLATPIAQDGVTRFNDALQGQTGACGNDCTGEGAISFLFAQPRTSFGLDFILTDGGTITLQAFEATGTAFTAVVLSGVSGTQSYTFAAEVGHAIAGVTITNAADTAGIGVDNLRLGSAAPEPAPLALVAIAALTLRGRAGARRSRRDEGI
jgi:hypothetical protein